MEYVDILVPPTFEPSGQTKTLQEAWEAEDWIGTFNLWVIQRMPVPALIYQVRSPRSSWAPGKLDVSAGGHYNVGELGVDGAREAREELGKDYAVTDMHALGRRLNVSLDTKRRKRNNVVQLFYVFDDAPLESYVLEEAEVYAICACPIEQLCQLHDGAITSFTVQARTATKEQLTIEVTRDSFPYNWDDYHVKIAKLAARLIAGEQVVY